MAKKRATAPKKDTTTQPKQPPKKEGSLLADITAIVLFFSSILILIFILSYFFSWKNDQSIAHWGALMESSDIEVENIGAKLGAILSEMIVGKWFGIFGLCLPIATLATSFMLVRIRTHLFRKMMISITYLMVVGSVSAAALTPESMAGIFGSSLGGGFGYYINLLLKEYLGELGTLGLLLMLATIWLVYTFRGSMQVIITALAGVFDFIKTTILLPLSLLGLLGRKGNQAIKTMQASSHNDTLEPTMPDEPTFEQEATEEIAEHAVVIPELIPETAPEPEVDPKEELPEEIYEIIGEDIEQITGPTPQPKAKPKKGAAAIPTDNQYVSLLNPDQLVMFTPLFDEEPTPKKASAPKEEEEDEELFTIIDRSTPTEPTPTEPAPVEEPGDVLFEISKQEPIIEPIVEPIAKPEPVADSADNFVIELTDSANIEHAQESDAIIKTNIAKQVDQISDEVYDPTKELSSYKLPDVELLENRQKRINVSEGELLENKNNIVETLKNFGIAIQKIKATIGPTVTLYEVVPALGVRISKIKNLEDDIALSLKALGIRIIAPIPGKGTIGIEVPNKDKEIVSMYSAIKSEKFQESKAELPVVLGKTIQNENFVIDLAKMPHLLVAGATGQGKSVGLNAIITSLLYKKHPAELKFVLIDPKKVEFSLYSHIEKHFLATLPDSDESVITDFQKVVYTLNSLCIEMDSRYDLLKKAKVRNIKEYNERFTTRRLNPNNGHRYLPYFVVVIDEFGDLIMTAGREIETPIARIAQLARAVGIHMIIATQRPSVSIITGAIKANFPARIAFRVATMIDSRTILDQPGANQLIGMGDMLISTGSDITRVQCAFVDTPEVERVVEFIGAQRGYPTIYELPEYTPEGNDKGVTVTNEPQKRDSLFEEIARYVVTNQQGSASTIQRNFSIGFNRAGRIMDQLEKARIVGRQEGSKPRQVLIQDIASLEVLLYDMENNINQ